MLLASIYDRKTRAIAKRYLRAALTNPLRLFRRLHFQSIMIIQPVDILDDGMHNMCDSCPDITVHEGELVWSCRLEEKIKYGRFIHTVPREHGLPEEETVERKAEPVAEFKLN
jgi:hypothetical protein